MRSPTRRAVLAVFAALFIVTAGCSGAPQTSTTTATGTDTTTAASTDTATATSTDATTETATWSPNASVDQYPPGVAANGSLTNVTTLLAAHFNATANESMALTQQWKGPNESAVRRYAHGASPTPYYSAFNRTTDGDRITEEFYWTGSYGYARTATPDETWYQGMQNSTATVSTWTHDSVSGPRFALFSALVGGNYSVNGTVERDGRTLVRLTADEVSTSRDGTYEAYEGAVLVTPDGVVYDVDNSFVMDSDGTTEEHENSITLETGTDWSGPPSWVADVPQLSVSTVENGHALEIRNAGGAPLPANASFTVSVSNETVWGSPLHGDATGTVTTDARLEPGEAVYVTVGPDGNSSSFALHDERARGEYTVVAAGVRGTTGNVSFRLETGAKDS